MIDLPRSNWYDIDHPPLLIRLRLILSALVAAVLVRADLARLGSVALNTAVFVVSADLAAWLAHLPAAVVYRFVDNLTPNLGRVALC